MTCCLALSSNFGLSFVDRTNHQTTPGLSTPSFLNTNPQNIVISAGIAVIQLPWMAMPMTTPSFNH